MSLIDEYTDFLRRRGRADLTIRNYRTDIKIISRALERAGLSADPRDSTEDTFLFLKDSLPEKEETVHRMLKTWDRFIEWATGQRILPKMGLLWNRPQIRRTFISPADYHRMMESARDPFERVILVLGGMMGCRRVEMVRLRLEDIHTDAVILHGKGHNNGLVIAQPINDTVRAELSRYLAWRATIPGAETTDRLLIFPRHRRSSGGIAAETTVSDQIPRRVRAMAQRAGVSASTHTLRRLFGTTIYNATNDLAVTAKLLRHADINTTVSCYIEPSKHREQAALELMCQALTS